MFRPVLSLLFSALAAAAFPQFASAQQAAVTAFAAASLQDALTSIGKAFTDHLAVRFSFASSAALARQIEQGAPADIFASADVAWMDWARARNLIKRQSRVDLLGNRLVLVAPSDAKFSTLALERNALGASGVIDGADPREQAHLVVRVTGADGYAAVISLGEISPQLADRPILLADQLNGSPLPDHALRLIVPGDRLGARSVRDVVRIEIQ